MKLDTNQHARILAAYVTRLSLGDLEDIRDACRQQADAQLNGNSSSQSQARTQLDYAIVGAVNNLIDHDKQLIENIVLTITE